MADDIVADLRIAGFDDSHPGDLLFKAADEIERLRTRETELDILRVRLTEALCSEMELADLLADELGKVAPSRIAGQMSALDMWRQARG